MTWEYENAGPGNVASMAELPRRAVLARGFGSSAEAAATLAISSLLQPFDNLLQQHITPWQAWQAERSERCAAPPEVSVLVRYGAVVCGGGRRGARRPIGRAPGAVVLLTPVYCGLMVIMTDEVLAKLKGSFSELWFETWPILAATAAMAAVVLLRRGIALAGAN